MNLLKKIMNKTQSNNENKYQFDLGTNSNITENSPSDKLKNKKVYSNIDVNLEYVNSRFNTLINSDIMIREFTINVKAKEFRAFIIYIDGMVDKNSINDFILKPLMMKNRSNQFTGDEVISEAVTNNIMVRRIKKFNIIDYVSDNLLPQNDVKKVNSFDKIAEDVSSRKLYFIY